MFTSSRSIDLYGDQLLIQHENKKKILLKKPWDTQTQGVHNYFYKCLDYDFTGHSLKLVCYIVLQDP